jgi:subtilase family serine protease
MEMIGLAYELGPAGANFDPPIDMTIKYDVSLIPGGVAEKNLVVAWWDETASNWVEMESTVDMKNDTIKAKVAHFTVFTILVHTRPASFDVADLSIIPKEADLGERISVSALVTNTGDLTGRYEVSLELDDVVVQAKDITLDGGDSETITFSITPDTAGEHTIYINGLLGTCEVKAPPPAPAPVPAVAPAPPSFAVSDLSVAPSEVKLTEQVTISAVVTNTRGSEGSYTVVLQINGAEEARKEVTLGAGKSETVTFIISKDTEGSYTVNIDGTAGQFVVVPPPPTPTPTEALPVQLPTNWWLIGGIIAGCIVAAAGLLVYFFVWRKRGAAQPS